MKGAAPSMSGTTPYLRLSYLLSVETPVGNGQTQEPEPPRIESPAEETRRHYIEWGRRSSSEAYSMSMSSSMPMSMSSSMSIIMTLRPPPI